jgi:WhiB family redox-sensing transcriptional regulator
MEVAQAKSLCGGCPVRAQCLEGALSRQEPAGVWGGELFEDGRIIAKKRKAGRPSLKEVAARDAQVAEGELIELTLVSKQRDESAA